MQTLTNQIDSAYEAMGQNGAKNLFLIDVDDIKANNTGGTWSGNTFTKSGATFTIDGDSVIFGGTPTGYVNFNFYQKISKPAIYKLSGLKDCTKVLFGGCTLYLNGSQVDNIVINSKNDTTLDLSAYTFDTILIDVKREANNVAISGTANLMLCLKEWYDTDPTYQPYAKTNQQLTKDTTGLLDNTEVNGAVNMLPTDIATQGKNDITVTNNGDGSYTVNCSSTEHNSANFISTKKVTLPKGTYKWTASADGKSPIGSNDCYAFIRGVNGTVDWYRSYLYSYGYGIITLTQESEIEFGLTVAANATVSNLTFKPMITVPSYNGDYVPYAKSNKELTEDVADARILIGSVTQHLSVIADGTKTIQTLMQELHSALSSRVASLNTDEVIYILGARSDGGTWFRPSNVELKYSKSSTVGNISMDSFTVTAGENCYHYSLTFSSTLATNTFRQMTVAQSGNTFVNRTSDVPSANSQLLLTYQIYKTIS
jgi:hypothetical protein